MFASPVRKRSDAEPNNDSTSGAATPGSILTTDLTWHRLVKGYLAFGPDINRLVKWTGLSREVVRANLDMPQFLKYVDQCRLNPKTVTPQRSEIICMLYVEAVEADNSRDRQSALRTLMEMTDDVTVD